MTAETANILRKAKTLVDKGWCKGSYARSKTGRPVTWDSDRAVSWCAEGAIFKVGDTSIEMRAFHAFMRQSPNENSVCFNDHPGTTKAIIIAAFDRAIAAEEAK